MLEINCYGSPEDRNSLNGQTTEEKLVKRIADAMADLSSAPTRAKVASHSLPATHHSTPLLEGRPAPGEFVSKIYVQEKVVWNRKACEGLCVAASNV